MSAAIAIRNRALSCSAAGALEGSGAVELFTLSRAAGVIAR